jgi:hypothetical protein
MKRPTEQTFKRLFALSKNQCAFTGCTTAIVQPTGTVTGKVCHIKSKRPNNKPFDRYDPTQTDPERHAFENLILLCGVHHDIVDNELQTYTVEILKKLKETHEQKGGTGFTPDDASVRKLIDSYLHIEASEEAMVMVNSPSAIQVRELNIHRESSPQVSLEFEFVMETCEEWRLHDPFPYQPPKKYPDVFLKIYAKHHGGGLAKIIQGFVWIPEQFLIEIMVNRGIQCATTPEEIANGQLEKIEVSNKLAGARIHQFAKPSAPDWKPIASGMRLCLNEVSIHHSCWAMLNKIPGSIRWQISADDGDAIERETKFADIPLIDRRHELR